MATNMIYKNADNLWLNVGDVDIESGDPVVVGNITGVALIDADAAGYATIRREGVFELPVTGTFTIGAPVYIIPSTRVLTNTSAGNVLFGYALEATSGDEVIKVLLKE